MFYTLSELITWIKDDIGICDIPLPVDDNALVKRFTTSALKEFSIRCPHVDEFTITELHIKDGDQSHARTVYEIPRHYYGDSHILNIRGILPDTPHTAGLGSSGPYGDFFASDPEGVLGSIADVQMFAGLTSSMRHSVSYKFVYPNIVEIYNGSTGRYRIEVCMTHDPSLSTVDPNHFSYLKELASLDMQVYLYNIMKRKNNLNVGVGQIELRIDDWQGAKDELKSLLRDWDDKIGLSVDRIIYY